MTDLPAGFTAHVANIHIKDATDDLVVLAADRPVAAAGVFTKSRFAGPSVAVSREHLVDQSAQAIVVISKNANVANGPVGDRDAREVVAGIAGRIGCAATDVLIASTGVIGRPYPMNRVRAGIAAVPARFESRVADPAAAGIMTTDTVSKISSAAVSGSSASIVGIAKGVGMLEPDMATMIAIVLTDADVSGPALDAVFRRVIDRTLNCVSIDTDTSTSDTAVVLASGAAGEVDPVAFEAALFNVCLDLTKQIARDGEGAETLIEVTVAGARDDDQAKRVAKAVVNSPLVKTAVHGADPNWGRVAMAIGKCSDEHDIDQEQVIIRFGSTEVYPIQVDDGGLADLSIYMRSETVAIGIDLGIADGRCTVWGCDLTDGYVRINADYTT